MQKSQRRQHFCDIFRCQQMENCGVEKMVGH